MGPCRLVHSQPVQSLFQKSQTENIISQRTEEYDLLEIFFFIYFTGKIKFYSYPFYASPRNIRLALLKQFE